MIFCYVNSTKELKNLRTVLASEILKENLTLGTLGLSIGQFMPAMVASHEASDSSQVDALHWGLQWWLLSLRRGRALRRRRDIPGGFAAVRTPKDRD